METDPSLKLERDFGHHITCDERQLLCNWGSSWSLESCKFCLEKPCRQAQYTCFITDTEVMDLNLVLSAWMYLVSHISCLWHIFLVSFWLDPPNCDTKFYLHFSLTCKDKEIGTNKLWSPTRSIYSHHNAFGSPSTVFHTQWKHSGAGFNLVTPVTCWNKWYLNNSR